MQTLNKWDKVAGGVAFRAFFFFVGLFATIWLGQFVGVSGSIPMDHKNLIVAIGEEKMVQALNFDRPIDLRVAERLDSGNSSLACAQKTSYDFAAIRRDGNRVYVRGVQKTGDGCFIRVRVHGTGIRSARSGSFAISVQ